MAASSSAYGSRKGMSRSLPYLSSKAIIPIAEYLSGRNYSDEGVLLAGMLFCGLWEEGNEDKIDEKYYNMNFVSSKDDPVGCVQMYLEENDIPRERMGELIDSSFEKEYLLNEPPFHGKIGIIPYIDGKLDYTLINYEGILDAINYEEILNTMNTRGDEWDFLQNSGMFYSEPYHQTRYNTIYNTLGNLTNDLENPWEYDYDEEFLEKLLDIRRDLDKMYEKWIQQGVIRKDSSEDSEIVAAVDIIEE